MLWNLALGSGLSFLEVKRTIYGDKENPRSHRNPKKNHRSISQSKCETKNLLQAGFGHFRTFQHKCARFDPRSIGAWVLSCKCECTYKCGCFASYLVRRFWHSKPMNYEIFISQWFGLYFQCSWFHLNSIL